MEVRTSFMRKQKPRDKVKHNAKYEQVASALAHVSPGAVSVYAVHSPLGPMKVITVKLDAGRRWIVSVTLDNFARLRGRYGQLLPS